MLLDLFFTAAEQQLGCGSTRGETENRGSSCGQRKADDYDDESMGSHRHSFSLILANRIQPNTTKYDYSMGADRCGDRHPWRANLFWETALVMPSASADDCAPNDCARRKIGTPSSASAPGFQFSRNPRHARGRARCRACARGAPG